MRLIKTLLITISLTSITLFALPKKDVNQTASTQMKEIINELLKTELKKRNSEILKNIRNKRVLKKIYRENNYQSLWTMNGKVDKIKSNRLLELIEEDRTLNKNGLIYKYNQEFMTQLDENKTKEELLKLELRLTSHYYNFLTHTLYGEIQWKKFSTKLSSLKKYKINASWIKYKPTNNILKLISQPNLKETIETLTPQKFGYHALLLALEKFQERKNRDGGWKELPYFKRLKLGSSGDIVKQLKKRLEYSGDYRSCKEIVKKTSENNESNSSANKILIDKDAIFDSCLDKAVKKFQTRHGLEVDGIVGKGTRKALNITIEEKIKKILLNIDRIKWLPREKDRRYLIVNIPEFMLYYVENERVTKELRVITGDTKHPTPIFSEKISYIVLNPYWKVPPGIVRREIIPALIKDPNYLRKQGIEAHKTWNERSPRINVSGIFWEDYLYGGKRFPYRLMQPPGKRNALGKIKFKFPNRFSVYLHDTPTRYLFKKNRRAFSHGCIRLSTPEVLLETIATFNKDINMTKATKRLKGKKKKVLNVRTKLPVNIIYLTAGVNDNNEVEFRNDIYRYDKFMTRSIR